MTEAINKRKDYFIKKKFQGKFMFKFCMLVVLGAVITGAFLYLLSADTVTTAFIDSRLSIIRTSDYILPILISSSLISVVLVSIATVFVIMFLSHRIAGPLYKMEKSVKEIGEGNLNLKINLRSTDEITEMADRLNEMTRNIRERLTEIKSCVGDFGDQLDSLGNLIKDDKSLSAQTKNALKELLAKNEQLKKKIGYFKIN
ncbi:HAMP domain-containing protein [Candidatus Omnitrophota bacterium]